MKTTVWTILVAVALLSGCHREPAPTTEGSGLPVMAPAPGAPAAPAAESQGLGTGVAAATSALEESPTTAATSRPADVPAVAERPHPDLDAIELDLSAMALDEAIEAYVIPMQDGHRVVLTLDPALQEHLMSVVRRYDEPAEALVAIEPSTGRVLAWIEDHNERVSQEHPAASADPWAASVFKVITASILVEERNLGPSRRMCVPPGRGELSQDDLVSDEARDTRCVDFVEALAESVNAYFGRLFVDQLNPELVESWLLRFGFNQEIPFELEVATSVAEVPSNHLERARMGAGFRHSHLSPLHGAMILASIANGGEMLVPTLVDRVIDAEGEVIARREPVVWRRVMTEQTARTMTRALGQTTVSGTAARYFSDRDGWPGDLLVAGKTGTLSNRTAEDPDPDPLLIYSWFVGFAPIQAPQIAVAGLVYNGERWYIKGAYLASEAIIRFLR